MPALAGVGWFLVRRLAQRLERPYLDLSELIETASPSLTL